MPEIEKTPDLPDCPNYRRMRQENLLSLVVVSANDPERDRTEIEALAAWASARFTYYEILIIGTAPPHGWRPVMQDLGASLPNLRVITLQNRLSYEECHIAALDHAIGDYLISLYPGEIDQKNLDLIVTELADGQYDIVKTEHQARGHSKKERLVADLTGMAVRVSTGHRIEAFQPRAMALSRAAVTRMQSLGGALRFARFLDVSDQIATGKIRIDSAPSRRFWNAFSAKVRLVADLVSLSAARLIRSLAIICFLLALASFTAVGLELLQWIFLADVAEGWTSLAMLSSFLFGANFSVLAAICVGLLHLIRQAEPDKKTLFASELSGGDFFSPDGQLNVQSADGEQDI